MVVTKLRIEIEVEVEIEIGIGMEVVATRGGSGIVGQQKWSLWQ